MTKIVYISASKILLPCIALFLVVSTVVRNWRCVSKTHPLRNQKQQQQQYPVLPEVVGVHSKGDATIGEGEVQDYTQWLMSPTEQEYEDIGNVNDSSRGSPILSSMSLLRQSRRRTMEKERLLSQERRTNDRMRDKKSHDLRFLQLVRNSASRRIERIELINAGTDQPILYNVLNGSTIALMEYGVTGPRDLNFRAYLDLDGTSATSSASSTNVSFAVQFGLNNYTNYRFEQLPPYSLCGDKTQLLPNRSQVTDYSRCLLLQHGTQSITATAFTRITNTNATTNTTATSLIKGIPYTITFMIVLHRLTFAPSAAPIGGRSSSQSNSPTFVPSAEPNTAPSTAPIVESNSCSVLPQLIGNWEAYTKYPLQVAESQGSMFDNDFVLFSGFQDVYQAVTNRTFAMSLSSSSTVANNGTWREMDPMPIPTGITHGALAKVGNDTLYICGGYLGGHPGPATNLCLKYTHTNPPGTQWEYLSSLPADRAGGGLWFDTDTNVLVFTTGASRPDPNNRYYTIDHNDTWSLSLYNPEVGWVRQPALPYMGNHVGHVTVNYKEKTERHFIVGGQVAENEVGGNLDFLYEWDIHTNQWIQRQSMIFPRGHFSESTIQYNNCGFLIVAGAINRNNGTQKTTDISYYDVANDSWTKIGEFSKKVNTPVCTIYGGYLYCQSGYVNGKLSTRIRIV